MSQLAYEEVGVYNCLLSIFEVAFSQAYAFHISVGRSWNIWKKCDRARLPGSLPISAVLTRRLRTLVINMIGMKGLVVGGYPDKAL